MINDISFSNWDISIFFRGVFGNGQNLWTITKYTGYDPEIGSFNQNPLINGVDNGRFPVARSFTFGANVNF